MNTALMVRIKPCLQRQGQISLGSRMAVCRPLLGSVFTQQTPGRVVRALLSYEHEECNMNHIEILDFPGGCILFICLFYMIAVF